MDDHELIYDWNAVEKVAKLSPKRRIQFLDETLRDGIQSPSVVDPSIDDKLRLVDLANDRGNRVEPRSLCRTPATLAGNDLEAVAVRPKQDRLENTALGDRIGELIDRLFLELHPRLLRIRTDPANLNFAHPACTGRRLVTLRRRDGLLTKKGLETTT